MTHSPSSPAPETQPVASLPVLVSQLLLIVEEMHGDIIRLGEQTAELQACVIGFTNGGASFGAYQVDTYTMAYLNLLGPLLAARLNKELGERPISELMKACAPLTRDALEELAAYRDTQQTRDTLSNALAGVADPWGGQTPAADSGWADLKSSETP